MAKILEGFTPGRNCPNCGQRLINVGLFWVCPEHGQVIGEHECHPLRIFLSYGHDCNEDLVRRIKADLEARAHDVWFDQTEIKGGQDWRRSITDGIVASDRVLSFLSKHSMREPGVCIDEIAIAIGVKGGSIQTVLVEGEDDVRPPVSVSHIQWLDMHDWMSRQQAGGDTWEQYYQTKLAEIVAVVESEESRRFAGEIEYLERKLKPISSDSRIAQLLSKGLIGRVWLLDAVDKWRISEDRSSRLFCILGMPGVGKSTFAAHLAHYGRDKVIAVQFCEYDKPDHRDTGRIVTTLAFQLATRLPDYRKLLLTLPEIEHLEGKSAPELFNYLLAEPLRHVVDGGRERYLIVIDALDEAGERGRNVFVEMLAANAQRLPGWLGIVATSRPESDVFACLQGLSPFTLDTATESNYEDIREFLRAQIAPQLEGRPDADRLLEFILAKSEGVFLYAERFCYDVKAGNLSLDHTDKFPQGLGGTYFQYVLRQFPTIEVYRRNVRPALRAILAAREPLPITVLQGLFSWQDEDVQDFILDLGVLFTTVYERGRSHTKEERKIRPYHKSLSDYLTDETKAGRYFVSAQEGHCMLAGLGVQQFDRHEDMHPYFTDNLLFHLASVNRWPEVVRLANDTRFLKTITGLCARQDVELVTGMAPPPETKAVLLQVPERYLEMCKDLQSKEHIGLKGGMLPPIDAVSHGMTRPGGGMWDKAAYISCLVNLLTWYSRSLEIAFRFTEIGHWDTTRLGDLLGASKDLEYMTHQIWEKDYPMEAGATANLADEVQRLHHTCWELVRLKTEIEKTSPRHSRFLKLSSDQADSENELQALLNTIKECPRWHPKPAEFVRTLGAQEDYVEVYRFPCCGRTVITGNGSVSQYRADGCEDAPQKNRN